MYIQLAKTWARTWPTTLKQNRTKPNREGKTGIGKQERGNTGERGRRRRENGKGRKGKLVGEGRGWKGTALNYALKLQP